MPYGTAPLSDEELQVLVSWVAQGAARAPRPPLAPAAGRRTVTTWETFLNGDSLKQRVIARYLYEHWFVAHLYFDDVPKSPFFQVVRSRTAPGQPIDEIATVRPYDDPGAQFWYRLQPIRESIVHKTHIVYALGPKRLRAAARAVPRRRLAADATSRATRPSRRRTRSSRSPRSPRAPATSTCSTTRSTSS